MKRLKEKIILAAIGAMTCSPVLAMSPPANPDELPDKTLPEMITQISNIILILIGGVAVLFLIIGGFQYITSTGNPEQIQKAKNTIFYAILGLVAAILSFVVVTWIISQLAPTTKKEEEKSLYVTEEFQSQNLDNLYKLEIIK